MRQQISQQAFVKTLILLILAVALPAQALDIPYLPHQAAHACRLKYTDECATVCLQCHRSPEEAPLAEIDGQKLGGDAAVCGQCHEDHIMRNGENRYMFRHLGPSNHPSNVSYDNYKPGYATDPQGVKLFCDENRTQCTVQCSSCHDPHEDVRKLLRVENSGSKLCFSCHRK